jgi:hypothetical protein
MFVPTRYDDFAWENDRIAFRMYGPGLQNTDNLKEKLTSSGIDVWTKRVCYPVIEKWYSPSYKSYHEDSGEGLDFYKVGPTRGCGGIGIWKNGKMYLSENFVNWKIIANGPIRAIFEVTYNPWDVDGARVSEIKRVTLDAGSNLNRFDSAFKCDAQPGELTYAIGIALAQHPGGTTTPNKKNGWLSFWEPSELNGALGCAVVVNPAVLVDIVGTEENNLVLAKARSGEPATYYAGAGWQRSGDFAGAEDWSRYLDQFAQRLASPIKISITAK